MMNLTLFWYNISVAKKTCLYFVTFILAGIFATGVFIAAAELSFLNIVSKGLFVLFFLLAGMLHAFMYPTWLPHLHQANTKIILLYATALSVLISLSALVIFLTTGFAVRQLSVTAGCSFLLPSAAVHCWVSYYAISEEVYQPWVLPPEEAPKKMVAELLNDLELTIQLKQYYFDDEEATFAVIFPGGLELGKAFQHFLKEQERANIRLQLTDHQLQPYGWRFLLLEPWSNKVLNPEATLIDNKIKPKDTLLVQRIQMEKADLVVTKKITFHDTLY